MKKFQVCLAVAAALLLANFAGAEEKIDSHPGQAKKRGMSPEQFQAKKEKHVQFLEKRIACFKAANNNAEFKKCQEEATTERRQNQEKAKAAREKAKAERQKKN